MALSVLSITASSDDDLNISKRTGRRPNSFEVIAALQESSTDKLLIPRIVNGYYQPE
jgi:hypothetical protein